MREVGSSGSTARPAFREGGEGVIGSRGHRSKSRLLAPDERLTRNGNSFANHLGDSSFHGLFRPAPAGGRLGANPDAAHSIYIANLTWRRGTTRAIGALRNCRRFSRVCPNYFGCAYEIGNLFRGF